LPAPQIHLVLNAAYEASGLLAQTAAFARWPVADLICTHLDEEARWGKLWNLVLGTKFALGFLSAGQNVPGDFQAASLERLLPDR
jgi:flagellar biosynthesis GTPase FlhF